MKFKFGFVAFVCLLLLFASPKPTYAFSVGDIVDSIKNIFSPTTIKKELTVEPNITLPPNGDLNKNGKIDSGDTVLFTYDIENMTDNDYPFATLKTNIPRNDLNYIRDIKGAFSIVDKNGSTEIPNLYIHAHQKYNISFEATLNYFDGTDKNLDTQPQIFDKQNNKILEGNKFGLGIKALTKDQIDHIPGHVILNHK